MIRSIVAVGCALMIVAGCGDEAGPSPETSADAVSTLSTGAPAAPATIGVVAVNVSPCDLLTAEEVSAVTGLDVQEVLDDPPITCLFDLGADAGVQVFVTTDDGQGRLAGPAAVFEAYTALVEGGEAAAVAGLGERAVYAPGYRGLAVDAGGERFIGLGVNGGFEHLQDPRDLLVQLAAAALGRL